MPGRPDRHKRRLVVPGWSVPLIVVGVLLVAEVSARIVGPNIPRAAGTEERAYIKADQIYERGAGTDVAIVGSSETAGGLIPSEIEATAPDVGSVYNAALPGSNLALMEDWVDRIVDPQLKPKVVIIGMLPLSVLKVDDSVDPSGDAQAAIDAYESAIEQIDPGGFGSWSWRLRQQSALIRYRPLLRSPANVWAGVRATIDGDDDADPINTRMDFRTETDPVQVKANTAPDGEILDHREASVPMASDELSGAIYQRLAEYPADLGTLESLVDSLRGQGITPVIAVAPVDRTLLEAGGADLAPFDAIAADIDQWGSDNDVPVLDLFGETWDPTLFHDRNHLDEKGSIRWSQEVGTWLGGLCSDGTIERC